MFIFHKKNKKKTTVSGAAVLCLCMFGCHVGGLSSDNNGALLFSKRSPVSLLTPSITPTRQLLLPKSLKRDMWSLQFDLLTIK